MGRTMLAQANWLTEGTSDLEHAPAQGTQDAAEAGNPGPAMCACAGAAMLRQQSFCWHAVPAPGASAHARHHSASRIEALRHVLRRGCQRALHILSSTASHAPRMTSAPEVWALELATRMGIPSNAAASVTSLPPIRIHGTIVANSCMGLREPQAREGASLCL